jgi:hypothetical protein
MEAIPTLERAARRLQLSLPPIIAETSMNQVGAADGIWLSASLRLGGSPDQSPAQRPPVRPIPALETPFVVTSFEWKDRHLHHAEHDLPTGDYTKRDYQNSRNPLP